MNSKYDQIKCPIFKLSLADIKLAAVNVHKEKEFVGK